MLMQQMPPKDAHGRATPAHPVLLGPMALSALMPCHFELGPGGRIRRAGPQALRMSGQASLRGQCFVRWFQHASGAPLQLAELRGSLGQVLHLAGPDGPCAAVAVPLADNGTLVNVLSATALPRGEDAPRATPRQEDGKAALSRLRALCLEGAGFAMLLVDIDHFTAILARHGHECGEHVLRRVSQILRGRIRDHDGVFQLARDRFLMVLPGLVDEGRLSSLGHQLVAAISRPTPWRAVRCDVTVSIAGLVNPPGHRPTPQQAMERLGATLRAAQKGGRDRMLRAEDIGLGWQE